MLDYDQSLLTLHMYFNLCLMAKYNFSLCYCKTVVCWYVDSLKCRLRNYAKKLIFKEFVRHFDGISAFDQLISEIWFSSFLLSQPQQIDVSNSDTISLISSLLDAKLQKTFGDFKRSLDEPKVETRRELKKLKTDSKAASSLQFKGDRIHFEFNTQLLHCLDLAISNLSEGSLLGVQEHLQKAKCELEKRIKLIRFADKSPAGWAAVEEYECDELAENSEDQKKLRAAERRALTKIKQKSSKLRVSKFSNTAKSGEF